MDSYRREHSSRFPFNVRYDSVDVHVGQEGVQVHFGSFRKETNQVDPVLGVVVETMAHME